MLKTTDITCAHHHNKPFSNCDFTKASKQIASFNYRSLAALRTILEIMGQRFDIA